MSHLAAAQSRLATAEIVLGITVGAELLTLCVAVWLFLQLRRKD